MRAPSFRASLAFVLAALLLGGCATPQAAEQTATSAVSSTPVPAPAVRVRAAAPLARRAATPALVAALFADGPPPTSTVADPPTESPSRASSAFPVVATAAPSPLPTSPVATTEGVGAATVAAPEAGATATARPSHIPKPKVGSSTRRTSHRSARRATATPGTRTRRRSLGAGILRQEALRGEEKRANDVDPIDGRGSIPGA